MKGINTLTMAECPVRTVKEATIWRDSPAGTVIVFELKLILAAPGCCRGGQGYAPVDGSMERARGAASCRMR
jgi:hypothetical protein